MIRRSLARVLATLALALAFIMIAGAPANAATAVAAAAVITFTVPWPLVIGMLVSTVLPLLVGLVTKTVTNAATKAFLLAALAAVTGLLSELGAALTSGNPYDLGTGLLVALGAFLVAVGMHFGLYKPTGTSAAVQRVGDPGAS